MSRKITADALGFLTVTENCFYKRGKLIPAYAVSDCDGRFPYGAEKILYSPAVKRYFAVSEDAVSVSGDGVNFVRILVSVQSFLSLPKITRAISPAHSSYAEQTPSSTTAFRTPRQSWA